MNLGFTELILILIALLILVGPDQLPQMARTLGKYYAELNRYRRELEEEFRRGLEEVEKPVKDVSEEVRRTAREVVETPRERRTRDTSNGKDGR